MKYNIWNKWDPLKVCMLGNNYAPEFFDGCDPKASDPLKRICEETLEDLEGFKEILQDFGVKVIQPELDPNERFLDNPQRYPRGPLQPRDYQVIIGNKAYCDGGDHPAIKKCLSEYGELSTWQFTNPFIYEESYYDIIRGADYPNWETFLQNRTNKDFFPIDIWQELLGFSQTPWKSSAMCFLLGNRLLIGVDDVNQLLTDVFDAFPKDLEGYKVEFLPLEGHTDGNYHPIKPGAVLSLCDVQTYSETFPGWDVCYLPDQSWNKVRDFLTLKKKNKGKWWLAGEEDNDKFTHFVETWLQDWVGYVEETVFDVNVLMLDEHHCCVSNPHNEQVNAFLKKHKVEPVYVPWRHRYFWDGGLHCITLDLYREGTQKDYFA